MVLKHLAQLNPKNFRFSPDDCQVIQGKINMRSVTEPKTKENVSCMRPINSSSSKKYNFVLPLAVLKIIIVKKKEKKKIFVIHEVIHG